MHPTMLTNSMEEERSGALFDMNKYTAAHLPFGTKLKITNEANGLL
jgi:rare lipoprotein A (peptidoglycan hydrolase)